MLSNLFLLALTSLSVLSRTAAENPSGSDEFDKMIIQRALESTDFREVHKERTLSFLRELEVSQTCLDETEAVLADEDFSAYVESLGTDLTYYDADTCSVDANERKKSITVVCDVASTQPGLQDACETAGGQFFTITMEISGSLNYYGEDIKIKYTFKDIGSCAGASCNTDEIIEEAKAELDATKSQWESQGLSVKISGSEVKSTYFGLWIAVISTLAVFVIN